MQIMLMTFNAISNTGSTGGVSGHYIDFDRKEHGITGKQTFQLIREGNAQLRSGMLATAASCGGERLQAVT